MLFIEQNVQYSSDKMIFLNPQQLYWYLMYCILVRDNITLALVTLEME